MNCCHLDLSLSNIIVGDNAFIINEKDDSVKINPSIELKIGDFGVSEVFKKGEYEKKENENGEKTEINYACKKYNVSDKHFLDAPEIWDNEQVEDARKIGMFLRKSTCVLLHLFIIFTYSVYTIYVLCYSLLFIVIQIYGH